MATIITEIYVSIDNLEFTKLDLYKDEAFEMKYSKKDLQDITKVFAPFSKNFTLPATPKNKQAFGFFGNTEVIKILTDSKYFCKVYINGMLDQSGLLKLESVRYKNNKADSFTANFNTSLLSLKDRIGDDTMHNLSNGTHTTKWTAKEVYQRLSGIGTQSGLRFFAPLISNNRVWNYDPIQTNNDNIYFRSSNSPTSQQLINAGEIRPAVKFVDVLNIIKTKYNISVNTPLESTAQLDDLYIYGNNSKLTDGKEKFFSINNAFTNSSTTNKITYNALDGTFKVEKGSFTNSIRLTFSFLNTIISDDFTSTTDVKVKLYQKDTNILFFEDSWEFDNGTETNHLFVPINMFVANQLEFYISLQCDKVVTWSAVNMSVLFFQGLSTVGYSLSNNNNNADIVGLNKIDLIKTLPDIKVIDFLTSYFKLFNISIFDSSPNDENLYFLTPQDVNTSGQVYSKLEVDYTPYADVKEVTKSVNNPYNYYTLKHAQSSYRSNIDFKNQFGAEYGQIYYPSVKPTKANEFKVETNFSIIPPVLINGTSTIFTAYAFTNDSPEIIDGYFRYTPNFDELTLFYSHGNNSLSTTPIGCQNVNSSNQLVNSQLTSYIKVMPYCKSNGHSLSFSILAINGQEFPNTIYQLYYSQMITRLLNPNALSQTYNLLLPSSEIYLNDSTIYSGSGFAPSGFRLQNEIIIGETRFEILDASIDKTTGKTKITLLNF